eukprot:s1139_g22.t1
MLRARMQMCMEEKTSCWLRREDGERISGADLQVPFEGLELFHEVLPGGEDMEMEILAQLQAWPWQPSQSGRWKQDFGPKANFKKQQVKVPETWKGFPAWSHQLLSNLLCRSETLQSFEAVECLSLWYDADRGANHALHVDDLWLWGDRILGVSMQSASVFTFYDPVNQVVVRVPLPRRSAYLISGRVRVDWQHGLLAEDISGPRVAITFRELTEAVASSELGQLALERAKLVACRPEDDSEKRTDCSPESGKR